MSDPSRIPEDDRFHSAHVPKPKADCRPLRWEPIQSGDRSRVKSYTCDCQDTYYEFCQAGGQSFIRRTRRKNGETLVDECARGRSPRTMAVWRQLLLGEAA